MEHWLYESKPFCEAMAWVDLVLLANHESKKFVADGDVINIERGQTFTRYRSLTSRWGWGAPKVKRYLKLLERDNMIEVKSFKNGTLLTLVNYEVYQDVRNVNVTQTERKRNVSVTQTERERNATVTKQQCNNENNENNDNNENNENKKCVPKKSFGTFNHVKLTEDELNRLKGDFGESITEQAITFLDAYIEEKGYKSKSHNLAIRRWVINAVKENQAKQTKANRTQQDASDPFAYWGITEDMINKHD